MPPPRIPAANEGLGSDPLLKICIYIILIRVTVTGKGGTTQILSLKSIRTSFSFTKSTL